jgi:excisionase family DNA binding protein
VDRDPVLDVKWLTVAEVASTMRVSKVTVYRMCNDGELPTARFGTLYRIPETDFIDYLKARMPGHE